MSKETDFQQLVRLINERDIMAKSKKLSGKNKAIKSGNPAFKPVKNMGTKVSSTKGKLDNAIWRGGSRGK